MEERSNKLREILDDLDATVPAIEAVAVVSIEGLPIESKLPPNIDETRVAAMTAAMLSLGERASLEVGRGELERIFVESKDGVIILMDAGPNAVLFVSAKKNVKLGLIFLDMKRAASHIAEFL
ncbi:MAG: roadblock/LC7 domain-containing protein [Candidatus Heimdallarchaeota archaeon]